MRRRRLAAILGGLSCAGLGVGWWWYASCPQEQTTAAVAFSDEWYTAAEPRHVLSDGERRQIESPGTWFETRWRSLRPVRVLEVIAANRLMVETDFGIETVELAGVGGPAPWLPAAANAWLETDGRNILAGLVREGGDAWFELRCEVPTPLPWRALFPARTSLVHGLDGLRLVALVADPPRAERDLAAAMVEEGGSYSCSPFSRPDALWPEILHLDVAVDQRGFHALPCFRADRERLLAQQEEWHRLTTADLTRRGRAVAELLAASLPGLEPERLRFLATDRSGARRAIAAQLRETTPELSWLERRRVACQESLALNAVSPPGGTILVRTDRGLPLAALDWILVHEIVHQWQWTITPDIFRHHEAFCAYPDFITEAHAETVSLSFQRSRQPELPDAMSGVAYEWSVRRMLEEAAALGRDPREYADECLRSFPEPHLGGIESQRPETMILLHGGASEWRGLRFEAHAAEETGILIEVENVSDQALLTRFTGKWFARLAKPEVTIVIRAGESGREEAETLLSSHSTSPMVVEFGRGAVATFAFPDWRAQPDSWIAVLGCHDPVQRQDP